MPEVVISVRMSFRINTLRLLHASKCLSDSVKCSDSKAFSLIVTNSSMFSRDTVEKNSSVRGMKDLISIDFLISTFLTNFSRVEALMSLEVFGSSKKRAGRL